MPQQVPIFNYMASAVAIYLPFAFIFGASMASFLTVVMDRLPRGKSIVTPRSHCDSCKHMLPWYENLPIVGYIRLMGRCKSCGSPIPVHLFLNELLFAICFAMVFMAYFMVDAQSWLGQYVTPPYLERMGLPDGWPIFVLHIALFSALYAMTVIDLKTFTIPIQITWVITILAVIVHTMLPLWPAGGIRLPLTSMPGGTTVSYAAWVIPLASPQLFSATIGGVVGIAAASVCLHKGILRYGFLDFDLFVGESDAITDYPNPRRELQWELDYLAIVAIGLFVGWMIGLPWQHVTINTGFPLWCATLGGSLMGYFVGAGVIWGIRIFGTLLFGKEAMGLGDAHLLGCVGAVLGWIDPILIFLIAPFLAIAGTIVSVLLGSVFKGFQRILPYGPWLAFATVTVMFGDWWIEPFLGYIFNVPVDLP